MLTNIFKKSEGFLILDDEINSSVINRATCCMPVPGDKIIGVLLKTSE